ncbi:MAG: L,D-transpeptidase family protein [Planctomycetaceae bacterium]
MSRGRHVQRRGWRRVAVVAAVVLGVLALGAVAGAFAATRYERAHEDTILPGVRIGGVDVGGMTRAQAKAAVRAAIAAPLGTDFTISVDDRRWVTSPAELGRRADVAGVVADAMRAGADLDTLHRAWHRLRDEPLDVDVALAYTTKGPAVDTLVRRIAAAVYTEPSDAAIGINASQTDVVFHHAARGAKLNKATASAAIVAAVDEGRSQVRLRTAIVRPDVTEATMGRTIVVRVDQNRLYLYDGFSVERAYDVATAMPGFTTPDGVWRIWDKQIDPTWYNPALDSWGADLPAIVPGGPGNPMGPRGIYITAPGLILIHGNADDASIGRYASHGCIRMHNDEVIELYPLIDVGDHVVIVGTRPAGATYWSTPTAD